MLDQPGKEKAKAKSAAPALDFQQHLKALEAAGLVTRIDRPIDKDTELHTLMQSAEVDMTLFFRALADIDVDAPTLGPLGDRKSVV